MAAAEAALEAAPEDVELLLAAGRAYAGIWRYTAAIDVYDRAIAVAPDDWRPYRHRGHRYISTRRFDDAIADLDIDRRNPPADFRRQLRYLRRGDGAAQRHLLDHGVGPRGGYHHERGTVGRGSASAESSGVIATIASPWYSRTSRSKSTASAARAVSLRGNGPSKHAFTSRYSRPSSTTTV